MNKLVILGIRGVPAMHGGFETFAEKLSLFLVNKGWQVTVYCQEDGTRSGIWESDWNGVRRIHIPVKRSGAAGTVVFDWLASRHAMYEEGVFLTLGYNTAVFNVLQRFKGQINIINMDGIEWHRDKWGAIAKTWFWLNERFGCWIGNHLIADHPAIKSHLATRVKSEKISMIPYGGDDIEYADSTLLERFGLNERQFSIVIARPEPENSFLEMVRAFSRRQRGHKLVVLGNFSTESNSYHREVVQAASSEVLFPGAIYDAPTVQALRFYCSYYMHGHTVGGTNPSLVEALGAGCAVIAHDNKFNRWVAGGAAIYFKDEDECAACFDLLLSDDTKCTEMRGQSKSRFRERFTWGEILHEYETLLLEWYPSIK